MKRNIILSLLTAFLMACAFPPFRTGFIGWFALLPYFLLLEDKTVREGLRWSYLTGLFICITTLYWIGHVTQAGFIGAILIIPLYLTLYGLIHIGLRRQSGDKAWFLLPFVWLAIEYLQSRSELAFPWNYLGYTQSYYTPLIQYAEYTGVWGVSFWVMTLNVLFWLLYRNGKNRRQRRLLIGALAVLLLVPLVQGSLRLRQSPAEGRPVTVAVLQGNVDPFEKWAADSDEKNLALFESMSREAAAGKPDLILWPETALPFYLRSETRFLRRFEHLADSLAIPLLTGSLDYEFADEKEYTYYNVAFLAEPHAGFLQAYRKMRLVPGSERIPYRDYFPFNRLKDWLSDLSLGVGDYGRGEEYTVFTARHAGRPLRFAVPICYESAFPDLVRRFVAGGAEFLCIITNDAWFGRTSAPAQHAQFAVFRAIENRTPIARCANTGISCYVDASGRVSQRTALFRKAILNGTLQVHRRTTLYTRYGDWFPLGCAVVTLAGMAAALVASLWRRRTHPARS